MHIEQPEWSILLLWKSLSQFYLAEWPLNIFWVIMTDESCSEKVSAKESPLEEKLLFGHSEQQSLELWSSEL